MAFIYILSFGSNLGRRDENLKRGFELLKASGMMRRLSRTLETAPLPSSEHDVSDHEAYLNCVGEFISALPPRELYEAIRLIEDQVGHCRKRRWAPRHLDIDILFCALGDDNTGFLEGLPFIYRGHDGLRVPHSGIWGRPFFISLIVEDLGIPETLLLSHRSWEPPRREVEPARTALPASMD